MKYILHVMMHICSVMRYMCSEMRHLFIPGLFSLYIFLLTRNQTSNNLIHATSSDTLSFPVYIIAINPFFPHKFMKFPSNDLLISLLTQHYIHYQHFL